MLGYILLAFITVWVVCLKWKKRKFVALYNQIPCGFACLPIIGNTYKVIGNSEHQMKALQMYGTQSIRKGGVIGLWHAFRLYIMITDPVAAEVVLKTCLEKDDAVKVTQLVLGNGSIFASVPIWRPRRKILAPTFSPKNLDSFVEIFSRQSTVLSEQLKSAAGRGPVSMWNYLNTYAMDAVCETTMGVKVGSQKNQSNPILKCLDKLFELTAMRVTQPWLRTDFVFTKLPYYTTALKCRALIYGFVDKIIQQKRNATVETDNKTRENDKEVKQESLKSFMDLLIESSSKNTSGGYTDLELREEILVILGAGTDTSAVGAAFTLVMLSRHPDVQEKVYQELQAVFGDSCRTLEAEDLPRLKYLETVLKETLRLYPPVPITARKVESDVTLPSGVTLVSGCSVVVNIWGIHRNPRYWGEDAEQFRPERFIDTPLKHPAAFMPFSHGPRSCLGYQYAMMSMKTVLATVLRGYKILPIEDNFSGDSSKSLRVKFNVMMRHVDNYTVQLECRS